tara:strand:- start:2368 stop:2559 length:192 start_codon:yes stop_codon:yes gene_type:complete
MNSNNNEDDIKKQLNLMSKEELDLLYTLLSKKLYNCNCGIKLIGKYKKIGNCRKCNLSNVIYL